MKAFWVFYFIPALQLPRLPEEKACWIQNRVDVCFCFCWIKTLSVRSDHCRAKGCSIGDDIGPGRNGRRPGESIPFWPVSTPIAHSLVPTLPANGGHRISGADTSLSHTWWTTSARP